MYETESESTPKPEQPCNQNPEEQDVAKPVYIED